MKPNSQSACGLQVACVPMGPSQPLCSIVWVPNTPPASWGTGYVFTVCGIVHSGTVTFTLKSKFLSFPKNSNTQHKQAFPYGNNRQWRWAEAAPCGPTGVCTPTPERSLVRSPAPKAFELRSQIILLITGGKEDLLESLWFSKPRV